MSDQPAQASVARQAEIVRIINEVVKVRAAAFGGIDFLHADQAAEQILDVVANIRAFQDRAGDWGVVCFSEEVAADELERMDRLIEEVYEGLQTRNYPRERLSALERYVWDRPVGETVQEIGGIMMTLALWCRAMGVDMHAAGEAELARVWTKVDVIRAKQAAKPVGSALPVAAHTSATPTGAPAALGLALEGFADDYMTSETHHPGYVLIPTDKFERIQAVLIAQEALIGPRHHGPGVCKGCPKFETEEWREPSGDGETYDSGQYAWCNAAGRKSMGSYHYDTSHRPSWCPALLAAPIPEIHRDAS